MQRLRKRRSKSLVIQAAEVAVAAPQVVTHRLARMALAGPNPSPGDRREFARMGTEKIAAFYESWNAMFAQALRVQQHAWESSLRAMWFPWVHNPLEAARQVQQFQSAALGILGKGMAPVRKRAVGNAKRLRRPRPR